MSTWDRGSELDPDTGPRFHQPLGPPGDWPLTGADQENPPEFTGCRRCGAEDCPGGDPLGTCARGHVELTRERALLEAQLVELRAELDAERARAERAETDVVELTIERDAQERYAQELLRRVEGQVSA